MKQLICPTCRKKRKIDGSSIQLYFNYIKQPLTKQNIKNYIKHNNWACKQCIKSKSVITANYSKQVFGLSQPFTHYSDIQIKCKKCFKTFTFSKKEQQYWYENLKFNLKSKPKHCSNCRRTIRHQKIIKHKLEKEIAELLKQKKPTVNELIKLKSLYNSLGYTRKVIFIEKRINNKTKKK